MTASILRTEPVGLDALDLVEEDVRELVRRRALDPVRDPAAVRRLINEVLSDYEERSLTGASPLSGNARPWPAMSTTRSPASVPCSDISTTPRSRRCGSRGDYRMAPLGPEEIHRRCT